MFFEVKRNLNYNNIGVEADARRKIRIYILSWPMHSVELELDEYLKKKYKLGLKPMCIALLDMCKFIVGETNFIITFPDEKDDLLASLITYGNSELFGSKILKASFERYSI